MVELLSGVFYVPKDKESRPKGDDAHFISAERQTIAVADGVGGWWSKGIDPGEYARELIANAFLSTMCVPAGSFVDPKKVLIAAHSRTKVQGSSTACIVTVHNNQLRAANVGDSRFVLVREGKLIYKSPKQHRDFNIPFQLGNGSNFNCPTKAQEIRMPVRAGDVIVLGTDGLFDNIFTEELEELVKLRADSHPEHPEYAAMCIGGYAMQNSLNRSRETPFSVAANRAGRSHMGGKHDDITCIVAFVRPSAK